MLSLNENFQLSIIEGRDFHLGWANDADLFSSFDLYDIFRLIKLTFMFKVNGCYKCLKIFVIILAIYLEFRIKKNISFDYSLLVGILFFGLIIKL